MMNRRRVATWTVALVVIGLLSAGSAEARERQSRMRQLGRGITNVLTGWAEIPMGMIEINKELGGWAGITYGFFRGVQRCATREGVGIIEIFTFPMGYGPIIEPEFPFQKDVLAEWRVNPMPWKDEF